MPGAVHLFCAEVPVVEIEDGEVDRGGRCRGEGEKSVDGSGLSVVEDPEVVYMETEGRFSLLVGDEDRDADVAGGTMRSESGAVCAIAARENKSEKSASNRRTCILILERNGCFAMLTNVERGRFQSKEHYSS